MKVAWEVADCSMEAKQIKDAIDVVMCEAGLKRAGVAPDERDYRAA